MPSHRYIDETNKVNPRNHHHMVDERKERPSPHRKDRPKIKPDDWGFAYWPGLEHTTR